MFVVQMIGAWRSALIRVEVVWSRHKHSRFVDDDVEAEETQSTHLYADPLRAMRGRVTLRRGQRLSQSREIKRAALQSGITPSTV